MVRMIGIKQDEEWKEVSQMRQCWMASTGMRLLWMQSSWIFDRRSFLSKKSILLKSYIGNRKGGRDSCRDKAIAQQGISTEHSTFTETYLLAHYWVPYTLDIIKCTQQTILINCSSVTNKWLIYTWSRDLLTLKRTLPVPCCFHIQFGWLHFTWGRNAFQS